ncbi:hypothetical protein RI844_01945 [Thalassotalea fonticola]|uniref:Uncharacterized protein n=1 Tax=Thalassotalea fonticola TaxID=3065649 RepID=A0ABZ0GQN9_9GAMM|nr:hypothetical protein RI844_01945 [Colwelliaceae bacterium S1-1]
MNTVNKSCMAIIVICFVCSCSNKPKSAFDMNESQVEVRSYQTRAFDTTDRVILLRSIVATLQDLDFVIDKVDSEFGVVSATKLSGYSIRMTITIRPRGDKQLLVRASGHYNLKTIEDPAMYQDFYSALNKSTFLTSHEVD